MNRFNPQREEARLAVGFFLLLYIVGGGLIWWFYGLGGAVAGWLCITGGVLFFMALYGIVWLIGRWAEE